MGFHMDAGLIWSPQTQYSMVKKGVLLFLGFAACIVQ